MLQSDASFSFKTLSVCWKQKLVLQTDIHFSKYLNFENISVCSHSLMTLVLYIRRVEVEILWAYPKLL